MRLALAVLLFTTAAPAQWQIQQSNTTADLRGIHALGKGVAWASGSKGTVLRTLDGGKTWMTCALPPGGERLDFRAVQAFDAKTAFVMSSGKGDLSRLYKTIDGCRSWVLVRTNESPDGFWDSLRLWSKEYGFLMGDSVDGKITLEEKLLSDSDDQWINYGYLSGLTKTRAEGEGAFAASNSSIALGSFALADGTIRRAWFATGGASGSWVRRIEQRNGGEPETFTWNVFPVPIFPATESGGIFALAFADDRRGIAVGGDYSKPAEGANTAAFTTDSGASWSSSKTNPHGYRSSVAYSAITKTWITVGPNGTDVSTDDGRNWHPLNPNADESQHWNALSLPFVVGPHGRIGLLLPSVLEHKR